MTAHETTTAVRLDGGDDGDPSLAELWRLPVGELVDVDLVSSQVTSYRAGTVVQTVDRLEGTLLDVVFVDRLPAALVLSHSIVDHVLVPWHAVATVTQQVTSS